MFFCCCKPPPNCNIASDDFNRADDTDLGADWVERSGNWSIVSNQLDPPGTFARVTFVPEYTGDADGLKWSTELTFGGAAGTLGLIFDYVDNNNYHYVEVVCSGSTSAVLRIFKRASSTNTQLGSNRTLLSFNWSNAIALSVCWDGENIIATASTAATVGMAAATTAIGGDLVGLVTGSSVGSSARFDSVTLSRLRDDCPDCSVTSPCTDICEDDLAPGFLKLVVQDVANDNCTECNEANGTYIVSAAGSANATSQCSSSDTVVGCAWTYIKAVAFCTRTGVFVSVVLFREDDGEWYLRGAVRQSGQSPEQPDTTGAVFLLSLGQLGEEVDCFQLFETPRVLTFLCITGPDPPAERCDYASATITVSLP